MRVDRGSSVNHARPSEWGRNEERESEGAGNAGFRNHYVTLGVPKRASKQEIKAAFRRLARKCHPDVSHHHQSTQAFRAILAAYEVLSNDQQRQQYDFTLAPEETATGPYRTQPTHFYWGPHGHPSAAAAATTSASAGAAAAAAASESAPYSSAAFPRDTGDWWVPPSTSYRPGTRSSAYSASASASSANSSAEEAGAAEDSHQDSASFFRWPLNYSQVKSGVRRQRRAAHSQAQAQSDARFYRASAAYGSHTTHDEQQQQQQQQQDGGRWEQWETQQRHTRRSHSHSHSHSYREAYDKQRRGGNRTHPRHRSDDRADEWDRSRWQEEEEEGAEGRHPSLEPFTLPLSFSRVFLGPWVADARRFALYRLRSLFPGGLRSVSSALSLSFALFLLFSCAVAFGSERLLGVLAFALMWGTSAGTR
ncbi:hypothetical protein CLOP_g16702 [Closterium sp. NIES-67]|nr:hypothetical protein CLOP_g16702 [Closterium sp. NIES-67]